MLFFHKKSIEISVNQERKHSLKQPMRRPLNSNCFNGSIVWIQKQPPVVFHKKDILWNFVNFTRKHLCQNVFFNKVAYLRPATSLKKRLWHKRFPLKFTRFLRTLAGNCFCESHCRMLSRGAFKTQSNI